MASEAAQAREASMGFEAKKDRLSQTQDGLWKVTFTVKPEDMQTAILNAPMGTRYMLAAVEIGDNEEAVALSLQPEPAEGERAKRHFEAMCQDENFEKWFVLKSLTKLSAVSVAQHGLRNAVKYACGVQSANEFIEHPEKWQSLYSEFKYRDVPK